MHLGRFNITDCVVYVMSCVCKTGEFNNGLWSEVSFLQMLKLISVPELHVSEICILFRFLGYFSLREWSGLAVRAAGQSSEAILVPFGSCFIP